MPSIADMRDLSLHVLDLAQNSIAAGAALVVIRIEIGADGWLTLTLADDGRGMSEELMRRVTSPFATTRTTRKVGMGIPLMQENAQRAGGDLTLQSQLGKGTVLKATMDTGNIDCLPLGDLPGTLLSLILTNPETPDFRFEGKTVKGECVFDTREVRQALQGVSLNEPAVAAWLKEALEEAINPIFGGVYHEIFG